MLLIFCATFSLFFVSSVNVGIRIIHIIIMIFISKQWEDNYLAKFANAINGHTNWIDAVCVRVFSCVCTAKSCLGLVCTYKVTIETYNVESAVFDLNFYV